jgi:hypothetical protein
VFVDGAKIITDDRRVVDVNNDTDDPFEIIVPIARTLLAFYVERKETVMANTNVKPYRGAELRTHESYLYGRFRVRMKPAFGSGIVSSFFTYHDPESFTIDKWNEVDLEFLGKDPALLQFNTITPKQTNHEHAYTLPYRAASEFHIYGFEWQPEYVAWSVDDIEVYRQEQSHVGDLVSPQKIMMNIWQPNLPSWVGEFNISELPAYAFYDWVEYDEYTPGKNGGFTSTWRDDFDIYDALRWGKGTHTWEGNNAMFVEENAVIKDSLLILCLTMPDKTGFDRI